MMSKSPSSLLFFFLWLALLSIKLCGMTSHATTTVIRCHKAEKEALLELKQRLDDPSKRLSSWVGEDCCAWKGISCSNVTGHVIKLNLRNEHYFDDYYNFGYEEQQLLYLDREMFGLRGDISTTSWLQSLEELTHLDLSGNDFSGHTIPAFFGSFGSLTYLNLSSACFSGRVPDELGNLSALRHLDLSDNYYTSDVFYDSTHFLYVENPGWIARLTSLRHLNMSWVRFGGASSWFRALNVLPHIQDVELAWCNLTWRFPYSLPHLNFTSLQTLNLEDNYIYGTEPTWLYNITTLESLNFRWNDIYWSSINGSISKLTSLRVLDLSGNSISKNFLVSLSNLCNLQSLILEDMSIKHLLSNQKMALSGCLMYNLEELHLGNNQFNGHFPSWLGNMKNLKLIDLSENWLNGSLLVSPRGLTSLQYLNLRGNNLNGTIGVSIGQLKNLVHLDLALNSLSLSLIHLANLSNLKYLDISENTLLMKDTNDWMPPFQLQSLSMDYCNIVPRPHFPKWLQTQTTLSSLSLTNARIQDTIPSWFPSSLKYLYLNNNKIGGKLTQFFQNLTILNLSYNLFSGHPPLQMANMMPSLLYLDLSNNKFTGEMPQNFTKLQYLDFSNNLFSGHLPLQMAIMMPSLEYLYLSNNKFIGDLLQNFTNLRDLYLSNNLFSGHLPSHMANMMPSLQYLDLSNNKFTGEMLQNFTKLRHLDFSNNLFSGHLPLQMGNIMPSLMTMDLSNNNLIGEVVQNFTKLQSLDLSKNSFSGYLPSQMVNMMPSLRELYLSNNKFSGEVPQNFTKLLVLDLSNNLFSGHLNPTLDNTFSNLNYLDLSMNKFTGSIPHSFCQMNSLDKLRLSYNNFSGELPNCWSSFSGASKFDFSNNQIYGEIPNTFCTLQNIQSLHLSYNLLSGRIPLCLQHCTNLVILDVGHNNFTGNIPTWSAKSLPYLRTLSLRFNSLRGNIPELSHLSCLQILDLSNNDLSGSIPTSIGNFIALKGLRHCIDNVHSKMREKLLLHIKGNDNEYESLLTLITSIDLSNNGLSGNIPKELRNLHGLQNLNLSVNNLVGEIPKGIGEMQNLEVLDLSRNSLSGAIPSTLANLRFLDKLDLSYNNLSGRIPTGKQLQTFDISAYIGNPYLCGLPLSKKCTTDIVKGGLKEENGNDNGRKETIWLFTSITLGFIVGFWGILGTLLLHKRWRIIYFYTIDNTFDKLGVKTLMKITRKYL